MLRQPLLCGSIAIALVATVAGQQPPAGNPLGKGRPFGKATSIVATPDTLFRLFVLPDRKSLPASKVTWRGGAEVYQAVAPAVVIVRTETGLGSGFIVDGSGLVVTNHHVIASGLIHDPVAGGSYATVRLGRLGGDGTMSVLPTDVKAYLLKSDPTRDLALLRIAGPVPGVALLPHLTLSTIAPRPGQDCAIVGHPSSGMLWTMRPGQVAAVGQMPADMLDVVMTKLSSPPDQREAITQQLERLPSRRIILTSAQANHGDSGGPVVDQQGRVIAVTFGGPGNAEDSKFTYHVHLDELKAMLANVPAQPTFSRPDPWTLGPRVELQDLDSDGRPDVLLSGEDEPETFLLDLTNSTPPITRQNQLQQLVEQKQWRFNLALRAADGEVSAFYDTDSDGQIDLILTGVPKNGTVNGRFVREASGRWRFEQAPNTRFLNPEYLRDPALRNRADRMLRVLFPQK